MSVQEIDSYGWGRPIADLIERDACVMRARVELLAVERDVACARAQVEKLDADEEPRGAQAPPAHRGKRELMAAAKAVGVPRRDRESVQELRDRVEAREAELSQLGGS